MAVTALRRAFRSRRSVQALGLGLALVGVLVYFGVTVENFWTTSNLLDLLRQSAINTILSVGMTFVILTAGIDLSVGSALCLSAIVSAISLREGYGPVSAAVMSLFAGGLCGALNGSCIVRGRLSPFIVTLGTLWALRGVARWLCNDETILIKSEAFRSISTAAPLGIPMPFVLALVTVVLAEFILNRTPFGRTIFAVGGGEDAAWLSGVNVRRVKVSVYIISGLAAGLAAMVSAAKLGSGSPTVGVAYELDAIAATVLGGTSLMGGEGSAVGTLVGAIFIQSLRKGMSMGWVADYKQNIAIGVAIVIGALVDRRFRSTREAPGR